MSRVHALCTTAWVLSVVPTLVWWRDSLLWIAFMSVWANVAAHASAYMASRTKEHLGGEGGQQDPLPWLQQESGPRHVAGPAPQSPLTSSFDVVTEAIVLPITPRAIPL